MAASVQKTVPKVKRVLSDNSALLEACKSRLIWDHQPENLRYLARRHEGVRLNGHQITPLSQTPPEELEVAIGPEYDPYKAYGALTALRMRKGHQPVGRKIGFTNKSIWPEYNVDRSNWGYVWNNSDLRTPRHGIVTMPLFAMACEPKIEPEIVFGIKSTPRSSMNDVEILKCISWISSGFEVVTSIFPGWKFTAADTSAIGALHHCLIRNFSVISRATDKITKSARAFQLQNFKVALYRNGELTDTGSGSSVLGSPINALRHLCELLEGQDLHPVLQPGEIVTTGTLTRALPITEGDEWEAKIEGIELRDVKVRFEMLPQTKTTYKRIHGEQQKMFVGGRLVTVPPARKKKEAATG